MQLIRRETNYAVRALLHLRLADALPVSCGELAEACDIPPNFSYKILGHLRAAGLVESQPGRSGGFRLRGDPARITLRQVVDAIQGPVVVSRCLTDRGTCKHRAYCPLSAKLAELQGGMKDFLEETTLDDLAEAMVSAGAE